MDMLQVNSLSKIYGGKVTYRALTDIDLTIREGEFVGIMGPSGSGKTTLLNMIATIDTPTSGAVLLKGTNPHLLKKDKLALFRRRELGFVFQDFNLLDTLTIGENIVLPLTLEGESVSVMEERLQSIAAKLGIQEILDKRTFEVSGGQRQRTAIARAIIHTPSLLLADEPTGNLDSKSSRTVMETLESINKSENTTMMMVTHDALAASYCHRVIFIKDGQLHNEMYRGESRQVFFQKIIDALSFLGGNNYDLSTVRV
ncbi:ABC transporter ATP-binding protein [Brevibacillus centrosporus]|jgi:putative ABC transport system ATP-binding protein|uniref:Putative ABC transport system ATP-binding protein n=1 Tax=Brevibacillus centrosporus TaxID=54910 RepID=A0A1I3RHN0_9BACL|nr:ABC transporter ATP-binding protein [Brevibacillus centrosporus]MEC2130372.1 ABC transporter ATP-binding protein [Brevibacillus centrosporus]MED4909223.1 ABC transporter ATP-binding protein [Brevibacillus centrosporus]RNB71081.1 ABC transporter ATP-binding protein [Brevibacillus centrosporus]SFJ46114.1 putative ABC transport system ATP-binding protein [Brevibacillus centrosporus]GED30403.1 ABC transporter ATP-binding protein YxdL [Brevibacillus centrosporus]